MQLDPSLVARIRAERVAAGTVVGLFLPGGDGSLDVMGRCFWASVDEMERPVRQ